MKPGCFLKSIIILTILVAAIMYIIQHKSRLFFEPGKKMVTNLFMDKWDDEFKFVKDTPEKSELKKSLQTFLKDLKYENIPEDKELNNIVEMVKDAAKDSLITSSELKEISNTLKMKNENERPE
jgi:hypothetical protein